MRRTRNMFISAGLAVVAGVIASACGFQSSSNCELTGKCARSSAGKRPLSSTPEQCIPSENPGVAISNDCGIFVSALFGDDNTGNGTKDKPFRTLATAFMAANDKGKPVYACIEEFAETVRMPPGSELYGGLDCQNDWLYAGETTRTMIKPPPNKDGTVPISLTVSSGDRTTIVQDVEVESVDATVPGGSSIAVVVDRATAEFTRCELRAGEGAAGKDGESLPADSSLDGKTGNPGNPACSSDSVDGGSQVEMMCGNGPSIGGGGGDGNVSSGGNGQAGWPELGAGQGGIGQPPSGSWSCSTGGAGNDGAPGAAGDPGAGAAGMGTLSASGYRGVTGQDGNPGTPGQGGGGGGGTKATTGNNSICSDDSLGGASGGSGGTGGCGGKGGPGGGPGGASIALVSLNASVTLTDCTLYARKGGNGGQGAPVQPGGSGGEGGFGGTASDGITPLGCAGGKGGQGGAGGPGGGGLGGPSIGIAYTGNAPEQLNVTTSPGLAGSGGLGGDGNTVNQGTAGESAEVKAF